MHELPHEIGDFAILLKKKYSLAFILLTQIFTATGAFVGGLLGKEMIYLILTYYIGIYSGDVAEGYLLGFTAGGFLYLALGNMIPELLHSAKKATLFDLILEVGLGLLGVGLIVFSC